MPQVVVIGGGISGLAASHQLVGRGVDVTLVEASDQLGGLGTFFQSDNLWIDRFYHCILPSDHALLGLVDEVGLTEELYWKPTRMGFALDGIRYPFTTPLDLLRFRPISFWQRIRLGAVTLGLKYLVREKDLDTVRTKDWLSSLYGTTIWEKVWEPLFRSKFGPTVGNVPALYLRQRLGRESQDSVRGYLRSGHKGLIDAIEASIVRQGGEVRVSTPVVALREESETVAVELAEGEVIHADWVISTVPLPLLTRITKDTNLAEAFRDPGLPYQGVVNALFFLSRPLDSNYWTPVLDSNTEFDGVVEMSTLVDRAQYGNRHLVYLMKYVDRGSDLFAQSDEEIAERWSVQLIQLYEDLQLKQDDILEQRVFRAPFVEPVYPLGYATSKPAIRMGKSRVFLATAAQVYPDITSWNSSTRLAGEVVEHLVENAFNRESLLS